jgi:IS30 family transposase
MQSYEHFTLTDRIRLQELKKEGKSNNKIAMLLGKHRSSIGRELKRNTNNVEQYQALIATKQYIERRKRSVRKLRMSSPEVKAFVVKGLEAYWSPEIISARWKMKTTEKLCHSTIYRAIKEKLLPGIERKTHLRRRGKRKNKGNFATIKPVNTIHDRPAIANERGRLGDLEGDTVYGAIGKGSLLTLVDRRSRYLYSVRFLSRTASAVKEAFKLALDGVTVNSITLDNGSEFAKFAEIEAQHNTTVYFADPHSPWQRGSNENVNGLIRFFFPKGTDFQAVSDDAVRDVVDLINNRPRKCLHWLSPVEFLMLKCCT